MKKIMVAFLLLFTCFSASSACEDLLFESTPPSSLEQLTVLCKTSFVVGYSTFRKSPAWTAHVIRSAILKYPKVPRRDNFRPDPEVPQQYQSSVLVYVGSGYDRGHMVPFDDLSWSSVEADKSFMMTNIIPQVAQNNRQIWKSVEMKTRKIASYTSMVYVITGTAYMPPSKYLKDGTMIPSHIWRVIIIPAARATYTFIIPNIPLPASSLQKYVSSLSALRAFNPMVNPLPVEGTFSDMTALP